MIPGSMSPEWCTPCSECGTANWPADEAANPKLATAATATEATNMLPTTAMLLGLATRRGYLRRRFPSQTITASTDSSSNSKEATVRSRNCALSWNPKRPIAMLAKCTEETSARQGTASFTAGAAAFSRLATAYTSAAPAQAADAIAPSQAHHGAGVDPTPNAAARLAEEAAASAATPRPAIPAWRPLKATEPATASRPCVAGSVAGSMASWEIMTVQYALLASGLGIGLRTAGQSRWLDAGRYPHHSGQ